MGHRFWEGLLANYRIISYWFPLCTYAVWQVHKQQELDGAPWWSYLGFPVLAGLAYAATFRVTEGRP